MKDGGLRIEKSDVFELSLVTIPANAEATIMQIKSADLKAALGIVGDRKIFPTVKINNKADESVIIEVVRKAAASGSAEVITPATRDKQVSAPKAQQETKMPRTIAEQITAHEAK